MWIAIILLACVGIIVGGVAVPKPTGWVVVVLSVLALIGDVLGWGPRYHVQFDQPHQIVRMV